MRFVDNLEIAPQDRIIELPDHFDDAALVESTQVEHSVNQQGTDVPIKEEPDIHSAKRRRTNDVTPRRTRSAREINSPPTQRLDIVVVGNGEHGGLGLGHTRHSSSSSSSHKSPVNANRPRLNHLLDAEQVGVVQVAVGSVHCAALTHDGQVLTWGANGSRALGRDTRWETPEHLYDVLNPLESKPTLVEGLEVLESGIAQVAVTDDATFVLTKAGLVYGWGTFVGSDGVHGFLRANVRGNKRPRVQDRFQVTPVLIEGLKNIKELSTGANHVLALTESGDVYAWGAGAQAELGRRLVKRHQFESLTPRMVDLPRRRIVQTYAGFNHSFAVDTDRQVWTWGLNSFGQTGLAGPEENIHVGAPAVVRGLEGYDIRHMAGGFHHSVACTQQGEVLAWGRCDGGQAGMDMSALPTEHFLFDSRGQRRILLQPTVIPGITATSVAAGRDNSLAITADGKVLEWGYSDHNRAGLGAGVKIERPTELAGDVVAGRSFTVAACGKHFSLLASPRVI